MERIIKIGEKNVGFKATALTPRLYRHKMGRDMIVDMNKLRKAFSKAEKISKNATEEEKKDAQLSVMDLEIFENVAWIMAKQYDSSVPDTSDEWLDEFDTFSIYEILPKIITLWKANNSTTSIPKKN